MYLPRFFCNLQTRGLFAYHFLSFQVVGMFRRNAYRLYVRILDNISLRDPLWPKPGTFLAFWRQMNDPSCTRAVGAVNQVASAANNHIIPEEACVMLGFETKRD